MQKQTLLIEVFLAVLLVGSVLASTIEQDMTVRIIEGTVIDGETISGGCLFETDDIILSANVDFQDCPGNVWVSVKINDGDWTNYSVIVHDGNTYSFTLDSSLINGGDVVYWQYYAEDCYGLIYEGVEQDFVVLGRTYLGVNPWPADGLNNWFVTEPLFSLTADDAGGDIYYQWDSIEKILYSELFDLDDIPNAPPKESAGTLDLNWWTEFACGVEPIQTQMFYVDLTNPEIIDLQPADESIVYNNYRPTISAYLDEVYQSNSGIDESSVVIKVNDVDVTGDSLIEDVNDIDAIVTYVPESDLPEGLNSVYISVTDNSGRNSELTWDFEIIITPVFSLKVYFPEDTIYDSRRVPFSVSTTEEVAKIEYKNWADSRPRWKRLCRNCDEYGVSRKRTKTLKEGENIITIRATDSYGQINEENINLFIDSRTPRISRTYPRRNKVINGSEFYIKYTENNLENITLFYGTEDTTKYNPECDAGRNKECIFNDVGLGGYEDTWIEYWFEVNDAINTKESRKTKVFVDTVSPVLDVEFPKDGEIYGRKVPFDITVTEDVTLEYQDNLGRWRRLCTRCDGYGNSRGRTKSFRRGHHNVLIRAVDKAGNSDVEVINFLVDY